MSDAETVLDTEITKSVDNSLTRKLKDIAAGFVGGATQVLIGQPADLVKIRLQTTSATSSFQVIKNVIKNEGILAFYKGTCLHYLGLVSVCPFNSTDSMRQNDKFYNTQVSQA